MSEQEQEQQQQATSNQSVTAETTSPYVRKRFEHDVEIGVTTSPADVAMEESWQRSSKRQREQLEAHRLLEFHRRFYWVSVALLSMIGGLIVVFLVETWNLDVMASGEKYYIIYFIIPLFVLVSLFLAVFRNDPIVCYLCIMMVMVVVGIHAGIISLLLFQLRMGYGVVASGKLDL